MLTHALGYHLEPSAGSLATFKIDPSDQKPWEKYSQEKFPSLRGTALREMALAKRVVAFNLEQLLSPAPNPRPKYVQWKS